jgi:hypothetical protein
MPYFVAQFQYDDGDDDGKGGGGGGGEGFIKSQVLLLKS